MFAASSGDTSRLVSRSWLRATTSCKTQASDRTCAVDKSLTSPWASMPCAKRFATRASILPFRCPSFASDHRTCGECCAKATMEIFMPKLSKRAANALISSSSSACCKEAKARSNRLTSAIFRRGAALSNELRDCCRSSTEISPACESSCCCSRLRRISPSSKVRFTRGRSKAAEASNAAARLAPGMPAASSAITGVSMGRSSRTLGALLCNSDALMRIVAACSTVSCDADF
mmetsp:Transcript_57393/g.136421  ORF Transcript_57393/g.136421 Transcript_57393/m.136421 type:complete len:232 (+) Transcript_57393:436-1131(+)